MADYSNLTRRIAKVLAAHEIVMLSYNPVPGDPSRTDGFWIAVAHCKCGHTSPPEHRAGHLAHRVEAELTFG